MLRAKTFLLTLIIGTCAAQERIDADRWAKALQAFADTELLDTARSESDPFPAIPTMLALNPRVKCPRMNPPKQMLAALFKHVDPALLNNNDTASFFDRAVRFKTQPPFPLRKFEQEPLSADRLILTLFESHARYFLMHVNTLIRDIPHLPNASEQVSKAFVALLATVKQSYETVLRDSISMQPQVEWYPAKKDLCKDPQFIALKDTLAKATSTLWLCTTKLLPAIHLNPQTRYNMQESIKKHIPVASTDPIKDLLLWTGFYKAHQKTMLDAHCYTKVAKTLHTLLLYAQGSVSVDASLVTMCDSGITHNKQFIAFLEDINNDVNKQLLIVQEKYREVFICNMESARELLSTAKKYRLARSTKNVAEKALCEATSNLETGISYQKFFEECPFIVPETKQVMKDYCKVWQEQVDYLKLYLEKLESPSSSPSMSRDALKAKLRANLAQRKVPQSTAEPYPVATTIAPDPVDLALPFTKEITWSTSEGIRLLLEKGCGIAIPIPNNFTFNVADKTIQVAFFGSTSAGIPLDRVQQDGSGFKKISYMRWSKNNHNILLGWNGSQNVSLYQTSDGTYYFYNPAHDTKHVYSIDAFHALPAPSYPSCCQHSTPFLIENTATTFCILKDSQDRDCPFEKAYHTIKDGDNKSYTLTQCPHGHYFLKHNDVLHPLRIEEKTSALFLAGSAYCPKGVEGLTTVQEMEQFLIKNMVYMFSTMYELRRNTTSGPSVASRDLTKDAKSPLPQKKGNRKK